MATGLEQTLRMATASAGRADQGTGLSAKEGRSVLMQEEPKARRFKDFGGLQRNAKGCMFWLLFYTDSFSWQGYFVLHGNYFIGLVTLSKGQAILMRWSI
jgi:hypothetical protein